MTRNVLLLLVRIVSILCLGVEATRSDSRAKRFHAVVEGSGILLVTIHDCGDDPASVVLLFLQSRQGLGLSLALGRSYQVFRGAVAVFVRRVSRCQTVLLILLGIFSMLIIIAIFLNVLPQFKAINDLVRLPLRPHEVVVLPAVKVAH